MQLHFPTCATSAADASVESAVAEYGAVSSVRFLEDRATCKSKGVAVVEFADTEAAQKCKAEFTG
jgi:RNA recognition motif-containing protein